MIDVLKPWTQLYDVISLLSPIFLFSVVSSVVLYLLFVVLMPVAERLSRPSVAQIPPPLQAQPPADPAAPAGGGDDGFGAVGSFSYLLLASQFGLVLGMLVKLLGGFSALEKSSSNTLVGAIGTVLVIVLGVVGSLFSQSGRIELRKPIGAIAFLLSFLVSGFYWKLLETAAVR